MSVRAQNSFANTITSCCSLIHLAHYKIFFTFDLLAGWLAISNLSSQDCFITGQYLSSAVSRSFLGELPDIQGKTERGVLEIINHFINPMKLKAGCVH